MLRPCDGGFDGVVQVQGVLDQITAWLSDLDDFPAPFPRVDDMAWYWLPSVAVDSLSGRTNSELSVRDTLPGGGPQCWEKVLCAGGGLFLLAREHLAKAFHFTTSERPSPRTRGTHARP